MYLPANVQYDESRAERFRAFCRKFLRHSDGAWRGKPFELLPWQWEDVAKPIFGRIDKDGKRLTRKSSIWIAKKNGKSELMAAVGLYMLVADGEPSSEVYIFATDRDQATLIFKQSAKMVRQNAELYQRLRILESRKRIVDESTHSFMQAEDSDAGSAEGLNAHCIIIDELHAQKKRDLFDSIRYAGAARRQPLFLSISTAGWDRESIGYEEYEHARRCLDDPTYDPTYHAVVYEALPEDDWCKESIWRKANPSLGVTIDEAEFATELQRARQSPRLENAFRRYRLNQWTQQASRWINIDDWQACAGSFVEEDLLGRACFGGLDLASTTDVIALALLFPDEETHHLLTYFWVPAELVDKRQGKYGARYRDWVKSGHLKTTPGNVADYRFIAKQLAELRDKFDLRDLAYDPWNATHMIQELQAEGFPLTEFRQTYKDMTGPAKEWERLVLARKLRHNDNPVMRWMMDNVEIAADPNGNIKPVRPKQREQKIDGVVAGVMALGRRMANGDDLDNVYENGGPPDIWDEEDRQDEEEGADDVAAHHEVF